MQEWDVSCRLEHEVTFAESLFQSWDVPSRNPTASAFWSGYLWQPPCFSAATATSSFEDGDCSERFEYQDVKTHPKHPGEVTKKSESAAVGTAVGKQAPSGCTSDGAFLTCGW